ncbi:rhamnulokinase [Listeria costaricensis]|uniref:rhamnulokinase n=1 Tax=Listeria costaricensis TaxID=2026604 RepID=UPI000C082BC5|nr:rhamnulokinase [Listeria costaricensis]
MKMHVAVDIGASSGRLVLGEIKNNRLELTEIHRFKNGFTEKQGRCLWNIDQLFTEILAGLAKVRQEGVTKCTLSIDTWAVDYALVDVAGERIGEVVSYRDHRTDHTIDHVTAKLPADVIYQKTGIQFLPFNTLYQLYEEDPALLAKADKILFVPDYLGFLLTGEMRTEVTNASTSQMLNLKTRTFDEELLALSGVRKEQFAPFAEPGDFLGKVKPALTAEYGLPETDVIVAPTHDTAAAVAGTPGVGTDWAYLSSGTWSLLGIESREPIVGQQAFAANYTNEWGVYGSYRFLKNIMGMWLVQEVARLLKGAYSFPELAALAEKEEAFQFFFPPLDERFLNPADMIQEIQAYCRETGQAVPETPGQVTRAIYDNLAICYTLQLRELMQLTGKTLSSLYIVGGGANVALLNQLTADLSGLRVFAGPTEATAIGNLAVQLIASKELADIAHARKLIKESFPIETYIPSGENFAEVLAKYQMICEENGGLKHVN